jgi:hypothetical protein
VNAELGTELVLALLEVPDLDLSVIRAGDPVDERVAVVVAVVEGPIAELCPEPAGRGSLRGHGRGERQQQNQ